MVTETSSIDDLLLSQTRSPSMPKTSEEMGRDFEEKLPEAPEIEALESESYSEEEEDYTDKNTAQGSAIDAKNEREPRESETLEKDEYGNEENANVRKRLSKQAQKHEAEKAQMQSRIDDLSYQISQLTNSQKQQINNMAQNFEADPNASGDWEQQLQSFVENTVQNMSRKNNETIARNQEQAIQAEFTAKFKSDMERFSDFQDVMTGLNHEIDDHMVYATRSMKSPAAFLYAAAKRAPQELQRIANMRDPYAKIAAIGALEVRLRAPKSATKAPRPIARTPGDHAHEPKKFAPDDPSSPGYIESLISQSDARRKAQIQARRR